MGLRIIAGRSRSGKTSLCLKEISEKQKTGKRLIYIVPEQYSLQAERELVAESGGIISAVVLSFKRLAENIFAEKGGISDKSLTDTGKLIILRRLLMKNKDKLVYFGVVCSRQGFITKLGEAISGFFENGITPEDLKKYTELFPENSAVALKLADVALIYGEYCNFIKSEYITSDDMLTIAAEKMKDAKYIDGAEVWLDGFYGFTQQEFLIITRLLASCKRVTVTLNIDESVVNKNKLKMENIFFEPWDTLRLLKKICAENKFAFEEPVILGESRYDSKGMARLENEYFRWGKNKKADSEGIKFFMADNVEDEVSMCASEIIHLVRDRGMRFRDIALTTRIPDEYKEEIELVFSHYGIPFFMDAKQSVMGHSCTELIRAIIDIAVTDISYEAMFRCLKTELTPVTRDERDILENYVLKYGLKGKIWLEEHWNYGFENADETEETVEKEERINSIKTAAIAPFAEFYKKYRTGKHTVRNITIDLYDILEKLELAEKLGKRAENAESEGDIYAAQVQIQCFELIGELMENMAQLLGDDTVTIKEYSEIFEAGISGLRMGLIPAGVDSVTIGDIERTRLPNIKALFVLGVNEGVLPSSNTETKGIFTDREMISMEKTGIEIAHPSARKAFEEEYLIYTGITKPSEYLYICRNTTDGSGRETRPSSVMGRIEDIFPDIEKVHYNENSINAIDRPIPVLHRLGRGIADENRIWDEAEQWLAENEKYSSRALMIKNGRLLKNTEGRLSESNIKKMFGRRMHTSVSRLETFAQCPFFYYARYSLKAKPRKIFEIRTPDLGTLFHGVLEMFVNEMKFKGLTWETISEEEAEQITNRAVDELAPDMGSKVLLSTAAHMYMLKRIKRITRRAVSVLKQHMTRGKFETLGSEIKFGAGDLPPISITMADGTELLLRGQIDRVDIYRKDGNGYIKIIDYKSGNKEFSLSDIYYGLQLQLLIYMDAFIKTGKILTIDEPQIGGAFYFRIMDPVIKGSDVKGNDPKSILFKKFCMSGLVCNEKDVIDALDDMIQTSGKSDIVNVKVSAKGELRGSLAERPEFDKLMEHTVNKAAELGKMIKDGDADISPASNKGLLPCRYCDYKSVCCFDKKNGNEIRVLKTLSSDDVWELILSEEQSDVQK